MPDYVDKAREAQQQHEQKHDVQLEIPETTIWANERERFERRSSVWYDGDELEYSYTHCKECGGEIDGEGWCPNYCMEGEK